MGYHDKNQLIRHYSKGKYLKNQISKITYQKAKYQENLKLKLAYKTFQLLKSNKIIEKESTNQTI